MTRRGGGELILGVVTAAAAVLEIVEVETARTRLAVIEHQQQRKICSVELSGFGFGLRLILFGIWAAVAPRLTTCLW